jgi:AcrR family transcriptional regulator
LLAAGKTLFAQLGYEQTPTAAIAREAGTSESQLMRYFGGKAGLLDAIFNESWKPLNDQLSSLVASATGASEAVGEVLSTLIAAFGSDHELAVLFLFEGRRMRGGGAGISLSEGFLRFSELVGNLVLRGQKDGSFSTRLNAGAISAALMGAAEGMIRERLIAGRAQLQNPFSDTEIRTVFDSMLEGLGSESAGARRRR